MDILIREALLIRELRPSLNGNVGLLELVLYKPLWPMACIDFDFIITIGLLILMTPFP